MKLDSIFDMFDVSDIKDGYAESYLGYRTYFYELKYNMDNDWINDDMIEKFLLDNAIKLANLPNEYLFQLLVFGFKNSDTFIKNRLANRDDASPIINEYLKIKREFVKPYKTIKVIFCVTPLGEEKELEPNLGAVKCTKLSDLEIANIYFNMLNPSLYSDDLKAVPKNINDLANPNVSIAMAMLKTPIDEKDEYLDIDGLKCKQFFMSTPPACIQNEFTLGGVINDLTAIDSDFMISALFRNKKNHELGAKRSFADSGLLKAFSSTNAQIVKNVNKLEDFLDENNVKPVKMSLQLALFNNDIKTLEKEARVTRTLKGFEGSVLVPVVHSKFEDYISYLPGAIKEYKYSFVVSSYQFASMLMFPSYDFNSHTIFEKKGRVLTSFDISNFKAVNAPGAMIFAPPGSGKSALLNYIFWNLYIQHPKMESLLIDFGGSYNSLYNILNDPEMEYTQMLANNELAYNPFDLDYGKPMTKKQIELKTSIIKSFFIVALGLEDERYYNLIEKTCEVMYNEFIFGNSKVRIPPRFKKEGDPTYYIEKYEVSLLNGEYDFYSFAQAMPTIQDFIITYGSNREVKDSVEPHIIEEFNNKVMSFQSVPSMRLFTNKSTQQLLKKHLIADLKEIALKDERLLNVILVYLINSKLLSFMNVEEDEKKNPRFIIIDEYNQFKTRSSFIDKVADTIFKVGRKENVHLLLITQNITDFNRSFFNVCGRLISFRPKSMEEVEVLANIIDDDVENLKPIVANVATVQGEYSELLVFNSDQDRTKNFYRLKVSPFEYYAFITTSAEDRARKAELIKEFDGDYVKVIHQMIKEKKS